LHRQTPKEHPDYFLRRQGKGTPILSASVLALSEFLQRRERHKSFIVGRGDRWERNHSLRAYARLGMLRKNPRELRFLINQLTDRGRLFDTKGLECPHKIMGQFHYFGGTDLGEDNVASRSDFVSGFDAPTMALHSGNLNKPAEDKRIEAVEDVLAVGAVIIPNERKYLAPNPVKRTDYLGKEDLFHQHCAVNLGLPEVIVGGKQSEECDRPIFHLARSWV
jgi:hypothetical protein